MDVQTINKMVLDFSFKVIDGEKESAQVEFLTLSNKILHQAHIWPPSSDQVCHELTVCHNFLLVNINASLCGYPFDFDVVKINQVILNTFKRVYLCICESKVVEKEEDTIRHQMLKIAKVLENPVFHFKSLTILARLLLCVAAVCMYNRHFHESHESSSDSISCFIKLAQMSSIPTLKEKCQYHHGLLLTAPLSPDLTVGGSDYLSIGDVVSLFLVTFQHPFQHFEMTHRPWHWLYHAMKCKQLMNEKSFPLAIETLHNAVEQCNEPHLKSRLLCLFADCYYQEGCPQLAIQTCKDALYLNPACHHSVLYQLSCIYSNLDLPNLELECLNLCVKAKGEDNQKVAMELDEMLWSVLSPIPTLSFIKAKVTFAKRCFQLKRYKEAAEQYSSLIKMIQDDETYFQFQKQETAQHLNIAEILVDAAEVLLLTQQFKECIRLCDDTLPSLSADESLSKNSQMATEESLDLSQDSFQSNLFDMLSNSQNNSSNLIKDLPCDAKEQNRRSSLCTTFEKSRKRLRSSDEKIGESSRKQEDGNSSDDVLTARLLLYKSDALVITSGFTDQAVSCIQQSMDMLLNLQASSSFHESIQLNKNPSRDHPPQPKRQRLSSEGVGTGTVSSQQILQKDSDPDKKHSVWSKYLLESALRMAKISWEKERIQSLMNCCHLVEQLDKGNLDAIYMKSQVLFYQESTKKEAMSSWLNARNVKYLTDCKNLKQTMKLLEEKRRACEGDDLQWWCNGEADFLEFDLACLKHILSIDTLNKI